MPPPQKKNLYDLVCVYYHLMLSIHHINALKSLTIRVIEGSEDVPVEHL